MGQGKFMPRLGEHPFANYRVGAGIDLIFMVNLVATGWPFLTERYFRRFTFGIIEGLPGEYDEVLGGGQSLLE